MTVQTVPLLSACEDHDVRPILPLRHTALVKRGGHKPRRCKHGEWRVAGADYSGKATKWRCPTGESKPASRWVKADRLRPLIPRETVRWKGLYRDRARLNASSDGLKHEWDLSPLCVRGIERIPDTDLHQGGPPIRISWLVGSTTYSRRSRSRCTGHRWRCRR